MAGFAAGFYLDRLTGVRGPFLIPLLLLGIGGGFWSCYRLIARLYDRECPTDATNDKKPT